MQLFPTEKIRILLLTSRAAMGLELAAASRVIIAVRILG